MNPAQTGQSEARRNRRRLSGILIKPKEQLKYSLLIVLGGLVMISVFIAIVLFTMDQTLKSIEITYALDGPVAESIRGSLMTSLGLALALSILLSVLTFVFSMRLTHRIYGPLVPMQKHIAALKAGNFKSRVRLRKGDDLQEMMTSLNELAEHLEVKYGSSAHGNLK